MQNTFAALVSSSTSDSDADHAESVASVRLNSFGVNGAEAQAAESDLAAENWSKSSARRRHKPAARQQPAGALAEQQPPPASSAASTPQAVRKDHFWEEDDNEEFPSLVAGKVGRRQHGSESKTQTHKAAKQRQHAIDKRNAQRQQQQKGGE
jgi:hypothetical protein